MAIELVVRDAFGLVGKSYEVGQHVTDPDEIALIEEARPKFVRRIDGNALKAQIDSQTPPAGTPAAPVQPAQE